MNKGLKQAEGLKYFSVGQRPTDENRLAISRGIPIIFQGIDSSPRDIDYYISFVGRCPTLCAIAPLGRRTGFNVQQLHHKLSH